MAEMNYFCKSIHFECKQNVSTFVQILKKILSITYLYTRKIVKGRHVQGFSIEKSPKEVVEFQNFWTNFWNLKKKKKTTTSQTHFDFTWVKFLSNFWKPDCESKIFFRFSNLFFLFLQNHRKALSFLCKW